MLSPLTFGQSFIFTTNFIAQMKNMYTPYLYLIFLFLTAISCKNTSHTEGSQKPNTLVETSIDDTQAAKTLTFQVIDAPNKTFGYEISVNGKKLIRQTTIPAVAGIEGFKTAAQAEKVAQFLIEKMKKNDALPAISLNELRELDVLQK